MPKPVPVPDAFSRPFWDACNESKLMVQHCRHCNKLQYPPSLKCRNCASDKVGWRQVPGKGHILEYTVIRDSRLKPLQADQPHNFVLVTLDEDPGLIFFSNLPGRKIDDVPIGAAVEVFFEPVSPAQKVAEWRIMEAK